jgi:glycosyltransferase involved in cell wall biosynthesis
MSHGNFVAAITRRLASPRTPLVWNIRQSICDRRYEKRGTRLVIGLNGQISSAPQQIIYNSVTGAEQHEAIGYNRSKRRIIPNGFDTEEFTPQESIRAAGRHELCVSDEEILVGVIARFHPVKNHAALFDAMARLCERTPRLRLLAVGHGMTADNSELQALIPESIRGRCLLLGRRSDIPKLTAALDIACNISVSEGFPNAIGEAMACAVPCVVTPTGDSPSIVGETGLVCKSASAADITDALDEMLSMSVDARRRLGCAARARVEEKYSLEAVVQQYEDLYEEVLESRVTGVSGATGDFCPKARNKDFGRSAIEPMKKTSIKEE